jgi:hypothetical protein
VKGNTEKDIYIYIYKEEEEEGKLSGRTNSMQKADKKNQRKPIKDIANALLSCRIWRNEKS